MSLRSYPDPLPMPSGPGEPASRPTLSPVPPPEGASGRPEGGAPGHRPARPPFPVGTALMASDIACPLLVLLVVVSVASWRAEHGLDWRTQLLFVVVSWSAFLIASLAVRLPGTVRRHLVPTASQDLGRAIAAVLFGAAGVLAADTALRSVFEPVIRPRYVIIAALTCIVALPVARVATLAICARWRSVHSRLVVLGSGIIAHDVVDRLARSRLVDVVGFVDDLPAGHQDVLGPIDALPAVCAAVGADRVVVAFSPAHPATIVETLRRLPPSVAVDVVPRYYELTGWQAQIGDLDGLTVVNLSDPPGPVGVAVKRALDVVGAGVVLAATFPVLLVAAAAVKATSPGPALFRQARLGRGRRVFQVLKLRTMLEPPDGGGTAPSNGTGGGAASARITTVGRILRRTGIDELPQLLNVLRGQMSLVGPRPFVPDECEDLPAWAEHRFDVRPGLTGLWQICGQHALRHDELYRLDAQYVAAPSLSCDLRILARTPARLLRGGGDRDAFRSAERGDLNLPQSRSRNRASSSR